MSYGVTQGRVVDTKFPKLFRAWMSITVLVHTCLWNHCLVSLLPGEVVSFGIWLISLQIRNPGKDCRRHVYSTLPYPVRFLQPGSRRVLFLSPGVEMAIVCEIGKGAYWVMGFLGGLKDLADFIDAEIFFSLLISLKSGCSFNFVKFGNCFPNNVLCFPYLNIIEIGTNLLNNGWTLKKM